jgi:hypothetical protein
MEEKIMDKQLRRMQTGIAVCKGIGIALLSVIAAILMDCGILGIGGIIGGGSYILSSIIAPNEDHINYRKVVDVEDVEVGERAVVTYRNGKRYRTEPVISVAYTGNKITCIETEHNEYTVSKF